MSQIVKTNLFQPVLLNNVSEMVSNIIGRDQLAQLIGADVVIVFVVISAFQNN